MFTDDHSEELIAHDLRDVLASRRLKEGSAEDAEHRGWCEHGQISGTPVLLMCLYNRLEFQM